MTPTVPRFEELHAPSHWRTVDFISDLHLQAADAATFDAWRRYMGATPADAVFILGDLFEVWVGDDAALPGSFETQCADVMRAGAAQRAVLQRQAPPDYPEPDSGQLLPLGGVPQGVGEQLAIRQHQRQTAGDGVAATALLAALSRAEARLRGGVAVAGMGPNGTTTSAVGSALKGVVATAALPVTLMPVTPATAPTVSAPACA